MMSLATSSTTFVLLVALFISPVSVWMECSGHPSYVLLMAACVGIDAFMTIPYSYLRFRKRPMRFALLKLVNIGINIGLNLFFIVLCPWLYQRAPEVVSTFYNPAYGIGYIFLSNFIASAINLLMLWRTARIQMEIHGQAMETDAYVFHAIACTRRRRHSQPGQSGPFFIPTL